MKEAYLVNNSDSTVSLPLHNKVPVTFRGKTVFKIQFKVLHPGEEFVVGTDLSLKAKKYYGQFKSILVDLKFRDVVIETSEESVEPVPESDDQPIVYDESSLMKKRQAELIDLAKSLGLEASAQESKSEITKKILEKILNG